MRYVILVGACERDNFGDIACAEITAKVLQPFPVLKAAMLSSDMRAYGGGFVVSAGALKRVSARSIGIAAVVFCGGETLGCDATGGLVMNLPGHDAGTLLGMPEPWRARALCATVVGAAPFAYVLHPDDILAAPNNDAPLIYHSVGGTRLADVAREPELCGPLQAALQKARHVSVRDATTQRSLSQLFGIDARLCPDTGFAMRRVMGTEIAAASAREPARSLEGLGRYIVFQANVGALSSVGLPQAAARLREIARRAEAAIVLQPSGTAFGHDSLEQLAELGTLLRDGRAPVPCRVQGARDFVAQAAVIGKAACWIGTSLHGRITALAMRVPAVSFANPKVEAMVETWETEPLPYEVGWDQVADATQSAMRNDPARLDRMASALEDKAVQGLEEVRALASRSLGMSAGDGATPSEATLASLIEENRYLRAENFKLAAELRRSAENGRRLRSMTRRLVGPVRAVSRTIISLFF